MQEYYQKWADAVAQSNIITGVQKASFSKHIELLSHSGAPVILNVKHLALLIGIEYGALKRMFYDRDKFYRSFKIKKKDGGDRLIEAPYPSLKMVQRWVLDNILIPSASLHPFSVGFVPGKSIVDNARPHLGHPTILKMDIKNFFPSITQASVERYFIHLGYDITLSATLAYLCCKDMSLPQGAPTSPLLSNILFYQMDSQLEDLANNNCLQYTRYADDISFSGERIPIKLVKSITSIAGNYHLSINQGKTRRSGKTSRKIITGVSISSGRLTIPREIKREIRQKVYYVLKYGLIDHLNHIESRDLLAGYRLLGLLAYWHSVEPDNRFVVDSAKALNERLRV